MNNLGSLINYVKSLPLWGKGLTLLALAAALAVIIFSSCTSTRSMAVTVDKAEKVNINLTDSVTGQIPFI